MEEKNKERVKGAAALTNSVASGVLITTFISPIVGVALGIIKLDGRGFLALILVLIFGLAAFMFTTALAQHLFGRYE